MATKAEAEEQAGQNSLDASTSMEIKPAADSGSRDVELKDVVAGKEASDAKIGVHVTPVAASDNAESDSASDGLEVSSAADGAGSGKARSGEVTLDKLDNRRPKVGDASETAAATPTGDVVPVDTEDEKGFRIQRQAGDPPLVTEIGQPHPTALEESASEVMSQQRSGEPGDDISRGHASDPEGQLNSTTQAPEKVSALGPKSGSQSDDQTEARERSELHGADESEAQGDCGGVLLGKHQHQSSAEEEAALLAARLSQQADRDALQRVVDEKTKVKVQLDDLQQRYSLLKEASADWEREISALRENLLHQDSRSRELEAEVLHLRRREREQGGKDGEEKAKELQGRLVTLANSDAEKDSRIKKLEEDLRVARAQLLDAERRVGCESRRMDLTSARKGKEPPQSKTCVVM